MKFGLPRAEISPRALFYVLALGVVLAGSARATPPQLPAPTATSSDSTSNGAPAASEGFMGSMKRSNSLLGDMWALRAWLGKYGITLTLSETSEVLGNVTGGAKQGAAYDGLTQMLLQLDTQRAFGLYGGTFNVSGLQLHGDNLSAKNLLTLQTASGIESDNSTRLWELWYQQKFLEEDRVDVKIGEQSLDQEFMVTQNGLLFVNTMFGWPMLPSADLPGGGPAYPLSAPGVRLRVRPVNALTILAGVFSGSPVGNNTGDPQMQNRSGTSFPLNNGALVITEVQFAYPSLGSMVYAGHSQPLAGVYKLGFWYDSEFFGDQQYDNSGLSLASGATTGTAATHHGDFAFYGVMDQMIWRDPTDEDGDRAISFFTRVMGTPEEDRNLIDFSLNAGFTFHEPIYHRDDDTFGLGMGFTKLGDHASGLNRDTGFFTGSYYPIRNDETFIEATYQYQLTPWCQLQPDFQYVFNPGGGILNSNAPGQRVKNEAVLGLRVNLVF